MSNVGSSHLRPPNDEPPSGHAQPSGSTRSKFSALAGPGADEAPTIISNGAPAPMPAPLGAHPLELGRKLEGERLGHFELVEFVGGGGMGAVFKATDTMLNRTVAVKVLSSEQAHDPETQRRFKNEAQSAARLDHANIARVYYVGEDRGVHYIVFEYIDGTNLRDVVAQRGPLALDDVLRVTMQLIEALAHASDRDVVHRDIKPSNVLITPTGRAKLVDMGLARLHQVEQTNDLTASGVTLGTFDYISPEQARDPRMADVRSDLYSLGCTMFFMLTGRPPFPEGTVLQKLLMHQGDEPPDPAEFRDDIPVEMTRIVTRLLAKSPARRYQTPRALADDVIQLSRELGIVLSDGDSASSYTLRDSVFGVPALRGVDAWRRHVPWISAVVLFVGAIAWLDYSFRHAAEPMELPPVNPLVATPTEKEPDRNVEEPPSAPATTGTADVAVTDTPNNATEPDATSDSATDEPPATANVAVSVPDEFPVAEPKETPVAPANTVISARPLAAGLEQAGISEAVMLAALPVAASLHADNAPLEAGMSLATGTSTKPEITAPPADPPDAVKPSTADIAKGVLIVAPGAAEPAFTSLRAAIAAASSGAVIELRFNGELVERPLLLANQSLTIRAGEGYLPRIVFRPTDEDIDPSEYPRSMVSLSGGALTLVNVDLELKVPRG
ncbi:MAG: protein kinase, partial [Planctomycetales bacterium]|nr:protein kinase [Planctomycetales bacterium]